MSSIKRKLIIHRFDMNLQLQGDELNLIKTKNVVAAFAAKLLLHKKNMGRLEKEGSSNLAQVQVNKGQPAPAQVGPLHMNNGSKPAPPAADVQKLQQQLQDIKEQSLKLIEAFSNETNFTVWSSISNCLSKLNALFNHTPLDKPLKNYGRKLFSNVAHRLGWDAEEKESHLDTLLRSLVLNKMISFEDPETIKEAKNRIVVTVSLLAQELGCYKMSLDCKDKLIKFYETLGYKLEAGNSNAMNMRGVQFDNYHYVKLFPVSLEHCRLNH